MSNEIYWAGATIAMLLTSLMIVLATAIAAGLSNKERAISMGIVCLMLSLWTVFVAGPDSMKCIIELLK